jgi:hypothetical protein
MLLLKRIEVALRDDGAVDMTYQQIIPQDVVPKLPSILGTAAARIEERPIQRTESSAAKGSRLPDTEFVCLSPSGAIVIARLGRAAHIDPEALTVALYPAMSPWWKRFGAIRLSKQIRTALREHGVIDLVKRQK